MKKFFITVLVLVLILGGAAVALPKLFPRAELERMVREKVKDATGRDIAFADLRIGVFPNLALRLKDVTLSNAPWARDKNMLEVGDLDVSLAVMPLLDKRIEVKRFNLAKPVIHLEKNAEGKGNWEFPSVKKAEAADDKPAAGGGLPEGFQVKLGGFKINDGALTFADGATKESIDNVKIDVTLADLTSPLHLDGALDYKGKRVSLALDVEKPSDLMLGKPSAGSLDVKTEDFTAKIDGNLATEGTLLKGSIAADVASLPGLAAWASGKPAAALPFTKVSFRSEAEATAAVLKLKSAVLKLDEVEAKGDVTLGLGDKPDVTARLALGKLALDRFANSAGGEGASSGAPLAGKDEGWSDAPIDFSGLKTVDLDLVLDTQGFSFKGAEAGPSKLTAVLKNGALKASNSETALFGGKFKSDLALDASSALAFNFSMDGVQAQPVLKTFADFDKLSGAADATVAVTGKGGSQRAIISSLAGNGSVVFRNGSFEGIDLANIAKLVQNRLGDMKIGAGKTDFVELGGTFTIASGVATNKDFKMKGPLVQAAGAGSVDLPRKYVDYRVTPVLTASSGVEGAKGLGIPVDIKGPFSGIKIVPDYQSIIKSAIEDPHALRDTVRDIKSQAKPMLKDLKKNPAKALEGLLGGGLPGLAAPAEAPPAETPPAEAAPAAPPAAEPAPATP